MATVNLRSRSDLRVASPLTLRKPYTPSYQKETKPQPVRHVIVVTGPAGCGKTSVAEHLAQSLNFPYIEGDNYHSKENVKKMSNGIPLTDADRWGWLDTLRDKAVEELERGARGVVVTCSALKRKYRDVIRSASHQGDDVMVRFVYLKASEELLLNRVKARKDHYMKDNMVKSQFSVLEEPDESEQDVISVDVSRTLPEVRRTALERVEECMAED